MIKTTMKIGGHKGAKKKSQFQLFMDRFFNINGG